MRIVLNFWLIVGCVFEGGIFLPMIILINLLIFISLYYILLEIKIVLTVVLKIPQAAGICIDALLKEKIDCAYLMNNSVHGMILKFKFPST